MADFTPIQEGDALSSAELDKKFGSLEAAVNTVDSVSRRTFDHYHNTHSVVEPGVVFDKGSRFMWHAGNANETNAADLDISGAYGHRYVIKSASYEQNATWPGFDSSTMATGANAPGWVVIGDTLPTYGLATDTVQNRTDGKLECTFGGSKGITLTQDGADTQIGGIGGILVMLNVEVLFFHDHKKAPQPVGRFEGTTGLDHYLKMRARFGIQVYVTVADGADIGWLNLKKADRALSMASSSISLDTGERDVLGAGLATSSHRATRGSMWKDISIRTLITDKDLSASGLADGGLLGVSSNRMAIKGVRAVISIESMESAATLPSGATMASDIWHSYFPHGAGVTLKAYSMTTLILSSEVKD